MKWIASGRNNSVAHYLASLRTSAFPDCDNLSAAATRLTSYMATFKAKRKVNLHAFFCELYHKSLQKLLVYHIPYVKLRTPCQSQAKPSLRV
jgi:hypothetical protein